MTLCHVLHFKDLQTDVNGGSCYCKAAVKQTIKQFQTFKTFLHLENDKMKLKDMWALLSFVHEKGLRNYWHVLQTFGRFSFLNVFF